MDRRNRIFVAMWIAALAAIGLIWYSQRKGDEPMRVQRGVRVHTPAPTDRAPEVHRAALPVRPVEPGPPHVFRGDRRHTGRSTFHGPRAAELAWKLVTQGRITTQPVLTRDGREVVVASHDHFLYDVALDTGQVRWKRDLGDRIYATPYVAQDGAIYVGSDADTFWSLAPNGDVRWRLATEGDADTGAVEGPSGRIYFASGNDLWAIQKDGTVDWKFRAPSKIYTTPAIDDDGTLYVGAQDDKLYAVAPDGRMRWAFATHGDNDGSPVLGDDGTIYFGSDDKHVYAVTRDGAQRWAAMLDGYVRGPLALTLDGGVLAPVFGPRPRVVCLEATTGDIRWFFPVTLADSTEVGVASGPIVDASGGVFFGAHDDFLYSLSPNGELRWIFEARGDVDGHPILPSDDWLLVGSDDGTLYALHGH